MIATPTTPLVDRPRKSAPRIDVATLITAAHSPEAPAAPVFAKTFRSRAARLARRSGELALAAFILASFAPAIALVYLAKWLDSE